MCGKGACRLGAWLRRPCGRARRTEPTPTHAGPWCSSVPVGWTALTRRWGTRRTGQRRRAGTIGRSAGSTDSIREGPAAGVHRAQAGMTRTTGTRRSARPLPWRSVSPRATCPSVARGSLPNAHPGETRAMPSATFHAIQRHSPRPPCPQAAVLSERLGDLRQRGLLALLAKADVAATAAGAAAVGAAAGAATATPGLPQKPGGPMLVRFLAPF